jgi:hypothetical protein
LPGKGKTGAVHGMGAKYLPTIKDQKAAQRFSQKQSGVPQFKKTRGVLAAKSPKKK